VTTVETPSATGLVVVDHGSSRPEANRAHESFVGELVDHSPYLAVEAAHMELAEPTIAQAFDRCVAAGATTVVVAPYFLWPGRHWAADIPELVAEASRGHRGVRSLVAAPLGPHPMLAELVGVRVEQCLAHAQGGEPCVLCTGTEHCRLR
jgi:sirohydrochlorin ferrochelatase